MTMRLHTLALATAILLPASGLAMAQQVTPAAPATPSAPQDIGLGAAIGAARGAFDGHVIEAEREMRNGRSVYEVDLVRNGEIHRAVVDAESGTVSSVDKRMLASTWRRWFDADRLTTVESLPGDLGTRLAEVERQSGGQAHEVSLDEERGRLFYEVEVITPTGDREVLVDASSGEILIGERDD